MLNGALYEVDDFRDWMANLYNYLMKTGGWALHRDSISMSRFSGERSNSQFAFVDGLAPAALLELPALLVPEIPIPNSPGPLTARVVTLTRARNMGGEIDVEYVEDPSIAPIPVAKLLSIARQLDIQTGGFALTHTHWAVRNADLLRVLLRHAADAAPRPTVFALDPSRDSRLISVMMPFDAGFTPVYAAIQAAATAAGYQCNRADDLWLHPQIMQTIVSMICRAGIVVCDCSRRNPNVFYEAGIAHTLGRDVILLAQHIDDVPFDLRHLSVILYYPNQQGLDQLTAALTARVHAVAATQTW